MSDIDEVSRQLGEITGKLGALDAYIHEHAHSMRQVPMQISGVGIDLRNNIRDLKSEMVGKIDAIEKRVSVLEIADRRRDGAWSAIDWLLKSNVVSWLLAGLLAAWAILKGSR